VAKTREEIYAELDRLKKLAKQLRDAAAGMKSLAGGEYQTQIDVIRANWSGETAEQFLARSAQVRAELDETAGSLLNTAETLETIAKNYADAELTALALATG
jgi:WXG100 family type VII secretion target